jgi:hypothetical protein
MFVHNNGSVKLTQIYRSEPTFAGEINGSATKDTKQLLIEKVHHKGAKLNAYTVRQQHPFFRKQSPSQE